MKQAVAGHVAETEHRQEKGSSFGGKQVYFDLLCGRANLAGLETIHDVSASIYEMRKKKVKKK
jgi:hypothetical protein